MTSAPALPNLETVSLQRDGYVLQIGLNRPHKRNAFDRAMLADLSRAYGLRESDESLRAGVLFAHGEHFTGGLDLVDVVRPSRRESWSSPRTAGIRGDWTDRGPRRWWPSRTAGA